MAIGASKISGAIMRSHVVATNTTVWPATPVNATSSERLGDMWAQALVHFNGAATGDAVVHKRHSANDGTLDTNDGTAFRTVTASPGNAITIEFYEPGGDYVEFGIQNKDTTYSLAATIIYEGVKITGLS